MSNDKEAKDFQLEELEKPLTELEMKETTGGGTPSATQQPTGLYVDVPQGTIIVTNQGGQTNFQAGQFGYIGSTQQPPVVVPNNPGIQFTPPPAFNTSTPPAGGPKKP